MGAALNTQPGLPASPQLQAQPSTVNSNVVNAADAGVEAPLPMENPDHVYARNLASDVSKQYPVIGADKDWALTHSPHKFDDVDPKAEVHKYGLETFGPKDDGYELNARPANIPKGKYAVETYRPDTSADDVAGDILSHKLIHTDDTVKAAYGAFKKSLTKDQMDQLKSGFKADTGRDPSKQDIEGNLIPGAFRGRMFAGNADNGLQQDDGDFKISPEQLDIVNGVRSYIRGEKR